MSVPTPHNQATEGAFAKTVLMPGDPKRARAIAQDFLTGAVLVNDVRGAQGYTGEYQGKRVSVMASGMGMPAIGIHAHELFGFYGVENIIRLGTAGAVAHGLSLNDVVLAQTACTDSNYAGQYRLPGIFAPAADFCLLRAAADAAEERGVTVRVGNVLSSDHYYDDANSLKCWQKMGVLCVEMEAAALYMEAARAGRRALAILTISDCPFTGEELSAAERERANRSMVEMALKIA